MSTQIAYEAFGGGLDYITSALVVDSGHMSECLNFEQVFGKQGYRRMDGYERFDGRPEPHKADYFIQAFKEGSNQILAGDVVLGAGVTGRVVSVVLSSGAWDGTAAGLLILDQVTGLFTNNETITVGATPKAKADGLMIRGSISEAMDPTYRLLAVSSRRSAIQKVPGEGAILGLAVFRGELFAVRNIVGNASATLWRSSTAGWVSVRAGLYPGGRFRFEVANFSGTSTTTALFGVSGRTRMFRWDGAAFEFAAPIFGSEATSVTSHAVTTGSKVFTLPQTTRSLVAGDAVTIWSTANAANRMLGTVTAYSGTSLTVNVTSVSGSGTFTDWEIGKANFEDKPFEVVAHKDHIFLAYPRGQLQTSNLGNPMVFTSSAALFGMGDEITGMTSLKGALLGIFCNNRIDLLSGSSVLDWKMESHSRSAGSRRFSLQESAGNAIFLDERGLTTLQSTQNFGDFEAAIFSRKIAPYLDQAISRAMGSRMHRSKYQYRLYLSGGEILTATILTPEAVIRPSDVSFTRQRLLHSPSCLASGDLADGREGYFFGTEDGWVMREDVGTSFDGQAIDSVMKLHFNQFKTPASRKRFLKLVLELEAGTTVTINFRQQFDFNDGVYQASQTQDALALAGGGSWDEAAWNTFYWSQPTVSQAEANVSGVGRSMSLIFFNSTLTDEPFVLQGLLTHYSTLGMTR